MNSTVNLEGLDCGIFICLIPSPSCYSEKQDIKLMCDRTLLDTEH